MNQEAAMITLSATMIGALTGSFSDPFILSVENLLADSGWSQEKLFYESAKESIYLVLDGVGMIEGMGTPADLLSAGLYYLEGDRVNGNLSLVAAALVIGL